MFITTLSKLLTAARPHPWGGAASLRYTRAAGRSHRHSDRSFISPRNKLALGATATWDRFGLSMKAALLSAAVLAGVTPTHGQVFTLLTGNGTHLPLFGPIVSVQPGAAPALTVVPNTSFSGIWGAAAAPAWQGTFTATGPVPAGFSATGTTLYDFAGLAGGVLPVNTYLAWSDVDAGSGSEIFTLKAFGIGSVPLSAEWLNSPAINGRGVGSGPGGVPVSADLPSWDWNPATFTYSFDGSTVSGNPTAAFNLLNNTALFGLEVTRSALNSNFSLVAAAVPEPSEYAAVAGVALAAFGAWRRTRR